MVAFLSWADVAKTVGAVAAAVLVVGGLVALGRWLRIQPRSPFYRPRPLPPTVDEVAQIQRDAEHAFYKQLMKISSAVEQFEPWERPGFASDLKDLRTLKETLDSTGKGPVTKAYREGSRVVQVERMARYAVIRTIDTLDGYRAAQPPSEDQRNAVRWQIVSEPRIVLEHAADLFRLTCVAAQETPLETVTNVESDSYLWNEVHDYARPAFAQYSNSKQMPE